MLDSFTQNAIQQTVLNALSEDVGSGDITAALVADDKFSTARLIARESAILCGIPWVDETARQVSPDIAIEWRSIEGESIQPDLELAILNGPAKAILTAERCLLNFLQTLSGTATETRHFCDLVSHTEARILDTRKTIPGLRAAQKYAVRIGGGTNHRMGLYDAYLIKENHISACGSIEQAIDSARDLNPGKPIEIEVESLEQLEQAITAHADIILLDNFTIEGIEKAVQLNRGRVKLEASGDVDKNTVVRIAETGVDFISIGSLTKHCRAIDFSLRFDN